MAEQKDRAGERTGERVVRRAGGEVERKWQELVWFMLISPCSC